MTHALIPSETGRGEGPPREANEPETESPMSESLIWREVSPRAALVGWSAAPWLLDLVEAGESARASSRQYFDACVCLYGHWSPESRDDKDRIKARRGRDRRDTPPDRLLDRVAAASPAWGAALQRELHAAFDAYFAEWIARRAPEVETISASDTIYLCELRDRLDGLVAHASLVPACAVETPTIRDRLREIDGEFEREVVPKLQSSLEIAHSRRLLSASSGRPDGWWGVFALNAGEVYASDPKAIEDDFVQSVIAETDLVQRKGHHVPRRGGPKPLQ